MNYGLYLSAAGMLTNMYRQDVAANNLANAQTPAFKRDLALLRRRQPESVEGFTPEDAHALLDRLGGGVLADRTRVDLTNGPLKKTGNDLDLALQGNGFFRIQTEDGVRLTRDGRFTLDPKNSHLMTTNGGHAVLDATGNPITLDPTAQALVDETGVIRQNGAAVARIGLLNVDADDLTQHGQGFFEASDAALKNASTGDARVHQGYLEQSNVDPVMQMLEMIGASSAISANANMIRYHDLVMDRAANVLGRVA
ncbi:flagellar hook-basal body protein [Planctomycetales bacterium ZRK34]|nr:flagellar hook-basal body protein [Planctomycetales bacterium ZRK34]